MSFAEIHDEIRSVASDLLAKGDAEWPLLVQAGWVGLDAPEDLGGAGAGFAEVAVICEELGKAAAATGYLGQAVLAVGALNALAPSGSRDELVKSVTAGATRAALALSGDTAMEPFTLTDGRLDGRATFVPDAADADRILLPARDGDGNAVLVDVPAGAPGLTVTAQPVLDETRRLATVTADGIEPADDAVWPFDDADLQNRAALAVACDSLGVAQAMLDTTVAYVGVRKQFGQPIGAFQAVKHACADMLVQIAVTRQLVAAAIERPDAVTVAMAKAHACDTAVAVTGKAMQLHGGIGYTWESGVHVYLKRAALNRSLFGSSAQCRARLAARYR